MIPGDFQIKKPSRSQMLKLGAFGVVSLGALVAVVLGLTFLISAWLGSPVIFANSQGPEQPIAFSHSKHVQDVGLGCTFCHRNVTTEAAATIPSAGLCLTCHITVGDGLPEIEKLRQIVADDKPIDWVRVHRVPDLVRFVHEAHIRGFSGTKQVVNEITDPGNQILVADAMRITPGAGIGQTIDVAQTQVCSVCHGNVAAMERVEQVRPLKMGNCVDCHRDYGAPTDCTTCHY